MSWVVVVVHMLVVAVCDEGSVGVWVGWCVGGEEGGVR